MNTKALYLSNLKYEIANNTAQSVCQKLKEIGNVELIVKIICGPVSLVNAETIKILRIDYDVLLHYAIMHKIMEMILNKKNCKYFLFDLIIDKNLLETDIKFFILRYINVMITNSKFITIMTEDINDIEMDIENNDPMILLLRRYTYYSLIASKEENDCHSIIHALNVLSKQYTVMHPRLYETIIRFEYHPSSDPDSDGLCILFTEHDNQKNITIQNAILNLVICDISEKIANRIEEDNTYIWNEFVTTSHLLDEQWVAAFMRICNT